MNTRIDLFIIILFMIFSKISHKTCYISQVYICLIIYIMLNRIYKNIPY